MPIPVLTHDGPPEEPLTHEAAIARARLFAQVHHPRIAQAETLRQLPPESAHDLVQSGLIRLLTPQCFGGEEAALQTFFDCIVEIGKVDASAAWCGGFLMLHSWLLAFFPLGVQRAIWKEDPDALIAAAFTPSMQVHLVEGGFRISGTSPFVSAIDPASWCLLAGWTPEEDEQPKQLRLFLLERRQYEILDDWDVLGLKGSGSKSVVVRDIFVPHEHTINLLRLRDGGASCHPQKLYQLPLLAIAPLVVLGPIVGATVGAYHFWLSLMAKDQTALGQERIAEFSHVQIRCSELEAALSMAQAFTTSTLQLLSSTQEISPAMRVLIRRNYAAVGSICREVIVELFSSGGAYWIKEQHPMQRYLRDILAACQHTALRLDEVATQHGRTLLDLPLTFIHELY